MNADAAELRVNSTDLCSICYVSFKGLSLKDVCSQRGVVIGSGSRGAVAPLEFFSLPLALGSNY